jgi:branched-chain amino acid transport system permease protein
VRFIFKTDYDQDIRLFPHGGAVFWYSLLTILLLLAPFFIGEFYVGEITYVFILATAGVGLMLLTGFTGLVSLGHASFLGIGAYAEAYFMARGMPFAVSLPLSGLIAGGVGVALGIPALRMTGIYLAIATLAFAIILQEVFARWESVTGGYGGLQVPDLVAFGVDLTGIWPFYYVCLVVLLLVIFGVLNIMRSPTGRALVAIRDSEIAAQSMGVNLARYKTMAFGLSAGITGLAGALFAHKTFFLSPDSFGVIFSIQMLLMVVVGGLGSLHGAIFGAMFIGALPQAIAIAKDYLPHSIGEQPGLESGVFGLILVLFVLFEPMGIYGRWVKIKLFFQMFPLYKRATFKRQKSYMKSERFR